MITLDIQQASQNQHLPTAANFQLWVEAALASEKKDMELTIRIVDSNEIQELNKLYRGKDRPTNILSFPFQSPTNIQLDLLGDLVICAHLIEEEAQQQKKPLFDHWTHIVVHGCLHLIGYDHINNQEAAIMEQCEIDILQQLGIKNPYIANEIEFSEE